MNLPIYSESSKRGRLKYKKLDFKPAYKGLKKSFFLFCGLIFILRLRVSLASLPLLVFGISFQNPLASIANKLEFLMSSHREKLFLSV
jgi:hypothetical protein